MPARELMSIGKSNFLYLDGHVELKNIRDTIPPNSPRPPPNPQRALGMGSLPYSTNGYCSEAYSISIASP